MKRVLVPLDRTEHSETVLNALPGLCEPNDEIVLLSVAEPEKATLVGSRPGRAVIDSFTGPSGGSAGIELPDFPVYDETEDQAINSQIDRVQHYLEDKTTQLKGMGFTNVHRAVEISKDPADAIADTARRVKPAFVLMTRNTHPGIGERLFGGVAQRVVREEIPVLILPGV